jgi:hypothetical protein
MREYRDRLSQDPAGYSLVGFGGAVPVARRVNASPEAARGGIGPPTL